MQQFLQKVSLFQGLNEDQIVKISEITTRKGFRAGTVLFQQNEIGNVFYIVLTGSVKIYTSNAAGEEKILSTFKAGDSFGELALIDGKPRSASAQTLEDSTFLTISGNDFLKLLQTHFDISLAIMQELCTRLRDTNQHVYDLTFLDARTRVIKNLITLANKNGIRSGNTIYIKLALNYDELSRMAGVTKNVLMQVIRDFEERQIIKATPMDFTLDLSKLR
ncbi:Crp/Fnr family transcriptional regulator [Paenibacillus thermotolerans]|uniref:Crp/Fnr family transcriptional regulator n=1 Tax=Paenibacillus thermotolerans TaxID=3027807 RepID=UPI0023686119|nr:MULTISPECIES: Crp/Fnr family transcriptional regulator [unclassified Paenibacillus]